MFISLISSTRQIFLENWETFSINTNRLFTSNKVAAVGLAIFASFAALCYFVSRLIRSNRVEKRDQENRQEERRIEQSPIPLTDSSNSNRVTSPLKRVSFSQQLNTNSEAVGSPQQVLPDSARLGDDNSSEDGVVEDDAFEDGNNVSSQPQTPKQSKRRVLKGQYTPMRTNGTGELECEGNVFTGTLKGGLLEGPDCSIVFQNGTKWEGVFVGGCLEGEGEIRHSNGDVERGSFKNSVLHGEGVKISAGVETSGVFENGEIKKISSVVKIIKDPEKKKEHKRERRRSFSENPRPDNHLFSFNLFGKSKQSGQIKKPSPGFLF